MCLPPAGGFFEVDAETRKFVDEGMRDICREIDIPLVPTDTILPYLNPWRCDQYHFRWNIQQDSGPNILWSTFDVNVGEFLRLIRLPALHMFCLQTCPYFGLAPYPGTVNHAARTDQPPPAFEPVTRHVITKFTDPVYVDTNTKVEMLNNCVVFFHLSE